MPAVEAAVGEHFGMVRHWLSLSVIAAVSFAAAPAPRPLPTPSGPPLDDAIATTGPTTADDLARLARTDPVGLLDACRRKFKADVRTYRVTFHKQERINGELFPPEVIRLTVREEPYAVLMLWQSGARKVLGTATEGVLFVAGENDGKMIVWRPSALLAKTLVLTPTDRQARASSRYAITEAGLGHILERTYRAWAAERDRGRLHAEYLGTRAVPEAGDRVCHVIKRTCDAPTIDPFVMTEPPPDPSTRPADAVKTITLLIDAETGFQLGSELRRADGELAGAYYYRDIELNPTLGREQFTPAGFKK